MDPMALVKDVLVLVRWYLEDDDNCVKSICEQRTMMSTFDNIRDMKEKVEKMKWPNIPSETTLNTLLRILHHGKGFIRKWKDAQKNSEEIRLIENVIEKRLISITTCWERALLESDNPSNDEEDDVVRFEIRSKALVEVCQEFLDLERNVHGMPVRQIYAGEGRIIGVGTYDGVEVHVKMPNKNLYNSVIVKKALEEFAMEKSHMEAVYHTNIATCLGGFTFDMQSNQPLMWLVYEKFTMNLVDAVSKKVLESEESRMRVIWGILLAISYLQTDFRLPDWKRAKPFILGNLKPSDIMLGPDNEPKLFELGLTKVSDKYLRSLTGIPEVIEYMAPEQIKTHQMTIEADVYSFGLVARYIWTGKTPTNEGRPVSKVPSSSTAERWMPDRLADGMPSGISLTLHQCIKPDPGNRPDAKQALDRIRFEMGLKAGSNTGGDANEECEFPFWRELNHWKFGDSDSGSGSLSNSKAIDDDDDDSGFEDDLYGIKQATIDKLDSIIEQFEQVSVCDRKCASTDLHFPANQREEAHDG
eukprot:748128-Hanusia_phi.AAC.1